MRFSPDITFEDHCYLGGDSGIGRAVALAYAREGASIVISYLNEHSDAQEIQKHIEEAGQQCILVVRFLYLHQILFSFSLFISLSLVTSVKSVLIDSMRTTREKSCYSRKHNVNM